MTNTEQTQHECIVRQMDRIAELEAENAELRAKWNSLVDFNNGRTSRIAALELEKARLRELLDTAYGYMGEGAYYCPDCNHRKCVRFKRDLAAVEAELQGGAR